MELVENEKRKERNKLFCVAIIIIIHPKPNNNDRTKQNKKTLKNILNCCVVNKFIKINFNKIYKNKIVYRL